MGTTFDVYPGRKEIPTFAALVERSTAELHRFLASVGVSAKPTIGVRLQRDVGHESVPFSLQQPARWGEDVYAWFIVGDVPGGTDALFDDDEMQIRQRWEREFDQPRAQRIEPMIRKSVTIGHRWWFHRSMGQSATVNIAYGLIAASLAALTDGFLTSDDGAWDWERMPALPDEFLTWYFRPEHALSADNREWSERCISFLVEELR